MMDNISVIMRRIGGRAQIPSRSHKVSSGKGPVQECENLSNVEEYFHGLLLDESMKVESLRKCQHCLRPCVRDGQSSCIVSEYLGMWAADAENKPGDFDKYYKMNFGKGYGKMIRIGGCIGV